MKRGFDPGCSEKHLSELIQQGIHHKGLALIDVLQPCVSFNKVNTFGWYKQRCYMLPENYDPTDRNQAMLVADEWGDRIPLGVIYRNDRPAFEQHFPFLESGPAAIRSVDMRALKEIVKSYS